MKTNMIKAMTCSLALSMAPIFTSVALAQNNQTTGEKVDEVYQDTKKEARKAMRKAKDKTCEMVNGKMECKAKELKHRAQDAADEVKDKVDDVEKSGN